MALPSSTYDTATLVNPTSSLTDFTLIVDLSRMSAAWWSAVDTTDGTKGRAAKDSGPTELACDWIDFDSVNETGLLRVKWSGTLATSGTQTLRVYPPLAANASVAANATYGSDNAYDADWAAYWPLHDEFDRTANGYDLTAQGGLTFGGTSGQLGSATDFDGSNDYANNVSTQIASNPSLWMFWVNPDNVSSVQNLYWQTTDPSTNAYRRTQITSSAGALSREFDGTTVAQYVTASISVLSIGSWSMLSCQLVSLSSRYGWHNDTKYSESTTTVTSTSFPQFAVGASSSGVSPFDGQMQHFQVHSSSRSDEWIEYEYDQTNDQATFWGTWTNTPVAGGISIPVVMHHRRMMGVS